MTSRTGCQPVKIGPDRAGGMGRGVFALADIAAGETLEEACTIELDLAAVGLIATTAIEDYYFRHPGDENGGLVVLGLASLCNHSPEYNAETGYRHDPALGWIVILTAARTIAIGEEITRRYACEPWFEVQPAMDRDPTTADQSSVS